MATANNKERGGQLGKMPRGSVRLDLRILPPKVNHVEGLFKVLFEEEMTG